jgi:pyranose oxidase
MYSVPFRDAEPQVTTPVSDTQPYHTQVRISFRPKTCPRLTQYRHQIHRDAFSYGAVASTIDTRTIVDLRFFGFSEPVETNTLTFETGYEDGYGMPQPTFNFHLSTKDKHRAHDMMAECVFFGLDEHRLLMNVFTVCARLRPSWVASSQALSRSSWLLV